MPSHALPAGWLRGCLAFALVIASAQPLAADDSVLLTEGRRLSEQFQRGETAAIYARMSAPMRKVAGSAEGLARFRLQVLKDFGPEQVVLSETEAVVERQRCRARGAASRDRDRNRPLRQQRQYFRAPFAFSSAGQGAVRQRRRPARLLQRLHGRWKAGCALRAGTRADGRQHPGARRGTVIAGSVSTGCRGAGRGPREARPGRPAGTAGLAGTSASCLRSRGRRTVRSRRPRTR